jgi:tRNA nucleotidyltransferase (CCA-adding enzyme)
MMARLADIGVLQQIHPEFKWRPSMAESLANAEWVLAEPMWLESLGGESSVFVYFALIMLPLASHVRADVMDRLKVRKSTRDDLNALQSLMADLDSLSSDTMPSEAIKILRPYRSRVLMVALAELGSQSTTGRQITQFYSEWRDIRTALNGNDLLEMGLEAGPQVGYLLDRLLAARLDGEVSDLTGERALLHSILEEWDSDRQDFQF